MREGRFDSKKETKNMKRCLIAIALLSAALGIPQAKADDDNQGNIKGHVLLISIDGMHALDYQNCVNGGYCPNLANLGKRGVSYTRTSTSKPSDSFPGLMALVTGGTPKTVGAFYDVAYDRVLGGVSNPAGTWNGLNQGTCIPGQPNGARTEYEEGVDIDPSFLSGRPPGFYSSFIDGDWHSIDPTRLPTDPFNNCNPVYPWNFIRANTIYGVIHKAGGRTAWSDKHAVYAAVSGPTGTATPSNVDDYYSPDVNSNIVNLGAGFNSAFGDNCNTLLPGFSGDAWTDHFVAIRCYDQLKVNAVVNWINGKSHLGGAAPGVPVIFGMNFQAVSVGQKLIESGPTPGGYTDDMGTPTTPMKNEIIFIDDAIGQMVTALKAKGLLDSTTIIITAKHGQSPMDFHLNVRIPGPPHSGTGGLSPASVLGLTYLSDSQYHQIGPTEDDISLLWLKPGSDITTAVGLLETDKSTDGVGQIFSGASITTMFNAPGVPPNGHCPTAANPMSFCPYSADKDPRTPDIIVQPNVGVVYSGSTKKQAEHGGFAHDDTNVMLLVSNPSIEPKTVTTFVETTQVAPTILWLLGLDPNALTAVQAEGTQVLPDLPGGSDN